MFHEENGVLKNWSKKQKTKPIHKKHINSFEHVPYIVIIVSIVNKYVKDYIGCFSSLVSKVTYLLKTEI